MSMDKKPDKKAIPKQEVAAIKKQHKENFKHEKAYGEPITKEGVKKLEKLIPMLRRDARGLGISQVGVQLVTEKGLDFVAQIGQVGYNVKDDGVFAIPDSIEYSYDMLEVLTIEELRAIAWHEFGHLVYAYYFPDSNNKADEDEDHYLVCETFCDEFAYKRFGDVLMSAQLKIDAIGDDGHTNDIVTKMQGMKRFKKKYGKHEYWLNLADTLGILDEIKYDPEKGARSMLGVRPKKRRIKGMYSKH